MAALPHMTGVLRRAGTIVVVLGDQLPYRQDAKATQVVLAAAQEAAVGRVLLVGPKSGSGGGFLFGGRSPAPEKVGQPRCQQHVLRMRWLPWGACW